MTKQDSAKVWTPARRASGTWVPGLVMALYMSVVVALAYRHGVNKTVITLAACFPMIWWISTALLSQLANTPMRNALAKRFARAHGVIDSPWSFVGASTPTFKSVWDVHEDVGLLLLRPEELHFEGDSLDIRLKRDEIGRITRKRHGLTWFGLGTWIEIWPVDEGSGCLLRLESRQKATRLGNVWESHALATALHKWHSP